MLNLSINGVIIDTSKFLQKDYEAIAGLLDGIIEDAIEALDPDNVSEEESIMVGSLCVAQEYTTAKLKELDPANY